jgi:ribosome-associated toxin RatA of RatAB toxin-antitoxin module
MRHVRLNLTVPDRPATAVYRTLADFGRYPDFSPAVRSVVVVGPTGSAGSPPGGPGTAAVSRWEVNFRRGVLRWVEEDTFDPSRNQIHFRQLEGDIALFDGSWSCVDDGADTVVTFAARLDMGIPSLADALEPIAVRTLIDNTVAIVSGLFEGNARVDDVVIQADEPATSRAV